MASHVWILYDERAAQGTEEAAVLEVCTRRRDLKNALKCWYFHDAMLFEYEDVDGELTNERLIGPITEDRRTLLDRCSKGDQ